MIFAGLDPDGWRRFAFTPEEASEWRRHTLVAAEAHEWRKAGFSPELAGMAIQSGLDVEAAFRRLMDLNAAGISQEEMPGWFAAGNARA